MLISYELMNAHDTHLIEARAKGELPQQGSTIDAVLVEIRARNAHLPWHPPTGDNFSEIRAEGLLANDNYYYHKHPSFCATIADLKSIGIPIDQAKQGKFSEIKYINSQMQEGFMVSGDLYQKIYDAAGGPFKWFSNTGFFQGD